MSNIGSTIIHFDYGGYYSDDGDDVRWNRKEAHIYTLVIKRSLDEVTYDVLVDKICVKIKVDKATTKLIFSYIPLVVCPKRPSFIFDDDDVFGYLMDVDQDKCRSVLHVELIDSDEENPTLGQLSRVDCQSKDDVTNEELASDARANDGICTRNSECESSEQHELVEYEGLDIVPGVTITDGINELGQYDNFNITQDTLGVNVDTTAVDMDTLAVVVGKIGNVEWKNGIGLTVGQEFESKQDSKI